MPQLPPMPMLRPLPPREEAKPVVVPLFRFDFKRYYEGIYTNRHDRFVLRDEHVTELKRVMKDYNRERPRLMPALSASDIINAALDFAFEHPVALARLGKPEEIGALCAYLVSDLAGYMTGATLVVDGEDAQAGRLCRHHGLTRNTTRFGAERAWPRAPGPEWTAFDSQDTSRLCRAGGPRIAKPAGRS